MLLGFALALQQPVAKLQRREAVFFVVSLDRLQDRGIAGLQPPLELDDRLVASRDGTSPAPCMKNVRICFSEYPSCEMRIVCRTTLIEVDEHLAPQEVVELLFARAVALHEPLERGGS